MVLGNEKFSQLNTNLYVVYLSTGTQVPVVSICLQKSFTDRSPPSRTAQVVKEKACWELIALCFGCSTIMLLVSKIAI